MIIFFLGLLVFVFLCYIADNSERIITLEEVNVGDKITIKGQDFTVRNYSENGLMEISDNDNRYIIKIDETIKLKSVECDDKRLYIELQGFKGTIGGDYLDKIKTT